MTVAAIILAAGRSQRFEAGNKLLVAIGGEPMLRHILNEAEKAPLSDIVVVVSPQATDVIRSLGEGRWRLTVAGDAGKGLSASLRTGIGALEPQTDGALILLGDMPDVDASLISRLIAAFRTDGQRRITCPVHKDGRRGNPVLWPKSYFAQLSALSGDTGGRALIEDNPADVLCVPVMDESAFTDIDTLEDWNGYRGRSR
jgi:molybdenum cofactor cytidylyltransferase